VTPLNRPVRRKVCTSRGDELVVMLDKEGIWLREPRRRTAYLLPYGVAFQRAATLYADAERRTKTEQRRAKKRARGAR
jgi:hypothetical protein